MFYLSMVLALFYILSRLIKLYVINNFFSKSSQTRNEKVEDASITLIQPITKGVTNLKQNLISRLKNDYEGEIKHIWICDLQDIFSIRVCEKLKKKFISQEITIIKIKGLVPATKVEKINKAIPFVDSQIVGFADDDIEFFPSTINDLVLGLNDEKVGAAFGVPVAARGINFWSQLNTLFVNSQASFFYIPLSYFVKPFTITGHLYLIPAKIYKEIAGLKNFEDRLHEDTYLAQKIRGLGLRIVQTSAKYRVHNNFSSLNDFLKQLRRWFVFTKVCISGVPNVQEKFVTSLLSFDLFLPSLILLFFVINPTIESGLLIVAIWLVAALTISFVLSKHFSEQFLWSDLFRFVVVQFLVPTYILYVYLFATNYIVWRGQKFLLNSGGYFDRI